ncbi:hypothetical protein MMC12_008495 [Toensbergia leucococca]|nr:hypothetical protein [Toensbergia leucococca]
MARKNAENIHNITSAWERSGLFPGNPQLIIQKLGLEKLKTRPITPPDITLRGSDGKSISLSLRTSVNIKDVDQILEKIKKDENDDDFTLIDKLGKACSSAIANLLLAQETNNDLIKIDKRKKDKKEKQDKKDQKELQKEFRDLGRLGPELFEKRRSRSPKKKPTVVKPTVVPSVSGPLIPLFITSPQPHRGGRVRGGRVMIEETIEDDEVVEVNITNW